ncbi:hypothetical protein J2W52_001613 [Rhizobium miluonense]|uniref:Uncharacterized protein n=1 Tax=Rhizobium miluonense TaxID=411945 RepID=A0ABU1SNE9_9HYPH|nr:hypothetical protein [Rhizobium miluonense]MDR6899998.1 hypothetical protein [Rhizobium miluonense]
MLGNSQCGVVKERHIIVECGFLPKRSKPLPGRSERPEKIKAMALVRQRERYVSPILQQLGAAIEKADWIRQVLKNMAKNDDLERPMVFDRDSVGQITGAPDKIDLFDLFRIEANMTSVSPKKSVTVRVVDTKAAVTLLLRSDWPSQRTDFQHLGGELDMLTKPTLPTPVRVDPGRRY